MKNLSYRVERVEYGTPCDHYACESVHRRFANVRYDEPQWVEVVRMDGTVKGRERRTHWHEVVRVEWKVIGPDGFMVETFDTRREAKAEADRLNSASEAKDEGEEADLLPKGQFVSVTVYGRTKSGYVLTRPGDHLASETHYVVHLNIDRTPVHRTRAAIVVLDGIHPKYA